MNLQTILFGEFHQPPVMETHKFHLADMPVQIRPRVEIKQPVIQPKPEALKPIKRSAPKQKVATAVVVDETVKVGTRPVQAGSHTGERAMSVYDCMTQAFPRWITSDEILEKTGINFNTLASVFRLMRRRKHLAHKTFSGAGRLRYKRYRLAIAL